MSKNKIIVNEWEKLTALSNRRLSVQTLSTPLKYRWSIDRLTIVGKLKENLYYHRADDILILDFEQLMRFNENNGYLESVSQNSWKIVDHFGENIAYIEMLKFQKGYGRIDFNPNKINQFLINSMKNFIHDLFIDWPCGLQILCKTSCKTKKTKTNTSSDKLKYTKCMLTEITSLVNCHMQALFFPNGL